MDLQSRDEVTGIDLEYLWRLLSGLRDGLIEPLPPQSLEVLAKLKRAQKSVRAP